jgi:hypothetical protein
VPALAQPLVQPLLISTNYPRCRKAAPKASKLPR